MHDDSNRLPVNRKLLARFFEKIRIDPNVAFKGSPCWLWTARIGHDGYGYFWFQGRDHNAQRISHGMFINAVDPKREVDHLCRIRECVNPVHLEDVPPHVNAHRSMSPTGMKHRQTHCIHGHEFSPENVYTRIVNGLPHRGCRKCRARTTVEFEQANRERRNRERREARRRKNELELHQ